MKILNAYAGIGGNRKDWPSHFQVTNVESCPKLYQELKINYPNDQNILGDAHKFILENYMHFDFIWSSPPCQTHSRINRINSSKYNRASYVDPQLIQQIIFLKENFKGGFCVENVKPYYGIIFNPTIQGRHCFWTNFDIECLNYFPKKKNLFDMTIEELKEHFGIKLSKNIYIGESHDPKLPYRNAVDPELGRLILERFQGNSIQSKLIIRRAV